jgi:hypothetical protein
MIAHFLAFHDILDASRPHQPAFGPKQKNPAKAGFFVFLRRVYEIFLM